MEKEISIMWNGTQQTVVIKRLNFGERNDMFKQATDIKMVSGADPIVRVDPYLIREVGLLKCLVKAPFPINIQEIRNLDFDLADQIYKEIEAINETSDKKKGQ